MTVYSTAFTVTHFIHLRREDPGGDPALHRPERLVTYQVPQAVTIPVQTGSSTTITPPLETNILPPKPVHHQLTTAVHHHHLHFSDCFPGELGQLVPSWSSSSTCSSRETLEISGTGLYGRPDALPVTQPTVSKH